MRFKLRLNTTARNPVIPINYQYPLSAVIYGILSRADADYAGFLHEKGYRVGEGLKRFKLFTFSDISCPFQIQNDRLFLKSNELTFVVSFHLPEASQHFIKGLFLSQQIDIADKKSKASFRITSVEALPALFTETDKNEVVAMSLYPVSPCVAGVKDEKGNYTFLSPDDVRFPLAIEHNWKEKLKALNMYSDEDDLTVNVRLDKTEPRSRLIHIKDHTKERTRIRGFVNFEMELMAKQKHIKVVYNSGIGIYNALGMGCISLKTVKNERHLI